MNMLGGFETSKFYEVTTEFLNWDCKSYIEKKIYVHGENINQVTSMLRFIPGVKFGGNDIIKEIKEINEIEYFLGKWVNENDPYFRCINNQLQRQIGDNEDEDLFDLFE